MNFPLKSLDFQNGIEFTNALLGHKLSICNNDFHWICIDISHFKSSDPIGFTFLLLSDPILHSFELSGKSEREFPLTDIVNYKNRWPLTELCIANNWSASIEVCHVAIKPNWMKLIELVLCEILFSLPS